MYRFWFQILKTATGHVPSEMQRIHICIVSTSLQEASLAMVNHFPELTEWAFERITKLDIEEVIH